MINPSLKEVVSYEKYFNSNDELRRQYQKREDAILDEKFRTYAAEYNKAKEIAINLLKAGLSIDFIAQNTGLSIEDVNSLQKML